MPQSIDYDYYDDGTLKKWQYDYKLNDATKTSRRVTHNYTYHADNRLKTTQYSDNAQYQGHTENYNLDPVDNLLDDSKIKDETLDTAQDDFRRMLSIDIGQDSTKDYEFVRVKGKIDKVKRHGKNDIVLTWDDFNRLSRIAEVDGAGTTIKTVKYTYRNGV